MAKYIFPVYTNPTSPQQEAEFNRWYDEHHLADVIDVPGFVAATRYRLATTQFANNPAPLTHRYLALYEIETDDLPGTMRALLERIPSMVPSEAIDLAHMNAPVLEQIGGRLLAEDVRRARRR
ncbi:MAG: hypothetical protein ISP90_17440 [Nevskia sp.]|nr:hypothetical protein [Nevskia sp.]